MRPANLPGETVHETVPAAATVARQPGGPELPRETVVKAKAGDRDSWNRLVDCFGQAVWTAVRVANLDLAASTQAAHTTWLRFADFLTAFADPEQTDPEQIESWLVATAQREASRYQLLCSAATDSP